MENFLYIVEGLCSFVWVDWQDKPNRKTKIIMIICNISHEHYFKMLHLYHRLKGAKSHQDTQTVEVNIYRHTCKLKYLSFSVLSDDKATVSVRNHSTSKKNIKNYIISEKMFTDIQTNISQTVHA